MAISSLAYPSDFQSYPISSLRADPSAVHFDFPRDALVYFRHDQNIQEHTLYASMLTQKLQQGYRVQPTPGVNGHCGLYAVYMAFRELCIEQSWQIPEFQAVHEFLVNLPPAYGRYISDFAKLLPIPETFDSRELLFRHYFSNTQLDLLAAWLGEQYGPSGTVVRIIYVSQAPGFSQDHTFVPGLLGRPLNGTDYHIFVHYSSGRENFPQTIDDTESQKGWEHYSGFARRALDFPVNEAELSIGPKPNHINRQQTYKFHGDAYARDAMLLYLLGRLEAHPISQVPGKVKHAFTAQQYGTLCGLNSVQQASIRKSAQFAVRDLQKTALRAHILSASESRAKKIKKMDDNDPRQKLVDMRSVSAAYSQSPVKQLPTFGVVEKDKYVDLLSLLLGSPSTIHIPQPGSNIQQVMMSSTRFQNFAYLDPETEVTTTTIFPETDDITDRIDPALLQPTPEFVPSMMNVSAFDELMQESQHLNFHDASLSYGNFSPYNPEYLAVPDPNTFFRHDSPDVPTHPSRQSNGIDSSNGMEPTIDPSLLTLDVNYFNQVEEAPFVTPNHITDTIQQLETPPSHQHTFVPPLSTYTDPTPVHERPVTGPYFTLADFEAIAPIQGLSGDLHPPLGQPPNAEIPSTIDHHMETDADPSVLPVEDTSAYVAPTALMSSVISISSGSLTPPNSPMRSVEPVSRRTRATMTQSVEDEEMESSSSGSARSWVAREYPRNLRASEPIQSIETDETTEYPRRSARLRSNTQNYAESPEAEAETRVSTSEFVSSSRVSSEPTPPRRTRKPNPQPSNRRSARLRGIKRVRTYAESPDSRDDVEDSSDEYMASDDDTHESTPHPPTKKSRRG